MLTKPKVILFDWDDTIVDSHEHIELALAKTFAEVVTQRKCTSKVIEVFLQKTFHEHYLQARAIYMRCKEQTNHRDVEKITSDALNNTFIEMRKVYPQIKYSSRRTYFREIFADNYAKINEIYKKQLADVSFNADILMCSGAKEVLELVQQQKIPTVIVSNKFGENLRREVKRLKLEKYFTRVVGAGDCEYDKPHPAMVHLALEGISSNTQVQDKWFIGDSIIDMECAHAANCTAILYGTKQSKFNCTACVHNHYELMNIIKKVI